MRTCARLSDRKSNAIHGQLSQLQDIYGLRFQQKKRLFCIASCRAGEAALRFIVAMHLNHCLRIETVKICQ